MTGIALTIHGNRPDEDGSVSDVTGTVSEPAQAGDNADWECVVRCAGLFPDETIKGASAAQALHLSRLFLLDALETNRVRLQDGDTLTH